MQASVAEQSRRREEAVHSLESMVRDRDHVHEQERLRLTSKIGEISEEVGKKVLAKEIKLRQEFQEKFSTVESVCSNVNVVMHWKGGGCSMLSLIT